MPSPFLPARKIDRHGFTAHRRAVGRVVAVAVALVASTLGVLSPAVAQTRPFSDTSQDAYYSEAVNALAGGGVFDGTECAQGMLCPGDPMDRKTMAVWTVRALDGEDPAQIPSSRFPDVAADSFHGPFIERMFELGVTGGCGDGTVFCPDDTVTRDQMAVFLTRAFDLDPGPDPVFTDVAPDAWYYDQVAALAASGITAGCGDGTTFCPRQQTTRAQMATFLARATGLVETPTATPTQPSQTYKAVTAGNGQSCAIATDNTITCWGANDFGQADAPTGNFEAVTAGGFHTCALRTDNTITCWGRNVSGQADAPTGNFKAVTAGFEHTCALRTDNTITCWGARLRSDYGPSNPPTTGNFKAVTAGGFHTCALRTDNTTTCWGRYAFGPTGAPSGNFEAVTAGFDHSCAIATDDTITCWGEDGYGQADAPSGNFKTVTAGSGYSCAIATDDTIVCWGNNSNGQADAPSGNFEAVTAGSGYSCAIATDDTIVCWGSERPSPEGVRWASGGG